MKHSKTSVILSSAVAIAIAGATALLAADKSPAVPAPKAAAKATGDTKAGGTKKGDAGKLVPENLAIGKVVSASSYQNDGLKATMAVDGDEGTRWCAENGSVPQWLAVDLGSPQDLSGAEITWEASADKYAFKLEGSADGKAWSALAEKSYEAGATSQLKFDAKGVRHVRVTVNGTKPGAWASLKELDVFGTKLVAAAEKAKAKQGKKAGNDAPPTPESVKAPAGWDVKIFGAPPEVNYCTTICATITGDVFVGIDEQGSLGKEAGRGRVVRMRDLDGDGKADDIVTFAKMDHPRGVWADGKDVYVLHPPTLTKYTDENGDGISDKSEVLIKGIANEQIQAGRGADHTTNGFAVGPDGWIYIAMGDFGTPKATGKDGTELQMHGGGVVRIRLDGTGLEKYSFGQRNIYDVAVDPFMNVFTRDNTNDGGGWNVRLSYIVPSGNYGYPRMFMRFGDEIIQPLNDFGGGSPCGSLFVDEPSLPPIANGLLTVEWGASKVWKHPLTPQSAGYGPSSQEQFLGLSRPTDIDYDGRGNFFVASWANGSFSYSGANVGFVGRVSPTGYKAAVLPDVARAADDDLVKLLMSPSMKLREAAQREAVRRGTKPATIEGLKALVTGKGLLQGRVAAMLTLKQIAGDNANAFLATAAADLDIRELALRALADKKNDPTAPLPPFIAGCKDANPRVRLISAWGLGRLGRAEGASALVPLTGDADPLIRHVAITALVELKAADVCLDAVNGNDAVTTGVLLALQRMHGEEKLGDVALGEKVVAGLTQKLQSAAEPALKSSLYRSLCRMYFQEAAWDGSTWWGTRPDTSGPYYKTAEWAATPKVRALLEAGLANEKGDVVRQLVVDMQRHKIDTPAVAAFITSEAKKDPKFRQMLIESLSSAQAGLTRDQIALLKSVSLDASIEPAQRVTAMRVLSKSQKDNDSRAALTDVLAAIVADAKPEASIAALLDESIRDARNGADVPYFAKLAESDKPEARELAYSVLVSIAKGKLTKGDQQAKAAAAVELAWKKPVQTASLLRAIGRTKTVDYREQVQAHTADKTPEVATAAAYAAERIGLKGTGVPAGPTIEQTGYEKTLAFTTKAKGNAEKGKELFTRVGCVGCHTVSASEPPKGPYLGGILERYNRAELTESIVKPNAKISQGFETQWFKLKGAEDDIIEGFVTREAGNELELRNAAGVAQIIKTSDIVKRGKRETSIMPEGLVNALTPQDLADLLEYLGSLKK
ncbi:DUF7133 domain-containing protein [Humisphaera borealis]|uniref:Discoidin domain-containing protein n=1 Tax=Humisphaera borealis TaxID=2807512 RepID=A0A7M2WUJ4_9BACT|nr:discoidin domain-containing protein [Humisphaera borealis]QOV89178.1 discoidin domain-containing protein [Humisphaera borealis]